MFDHVRLTFVLSYREALNYQAHAAEVKVASTRHPLRYAVAAMLAGAFIGVGVVLMVSTAGPLLAAGSPWAKLVSGIVFTAALTIVVFAGGELLTSNMMTLTQGLVLRSISATGWIGTLLFCFTGNLAGSVLFGAAIHYSGVLESNKAAGDMLASMVAAKATEGNTQLFFRALLCNLLVGLAIWMCARLTSDAAKLVVIFWAILAFISSGFEHVVANMTTYTIGLLAHDDGATWAHFGRNMAWVGLGNLAGGALLVGVAYCFVAGPRPAALVVATGTESTGSSTSVSAPIAESAAIDTPLVAVPAAAPGGGRPKESVAAQR